MSSDAKNPDFSSWRECCNRCDGVDVGVCDRDRVRDLGFESDRVALFGFVAERDRVLLRVTVLEVFPGVIVGGGLCRGVCVRPVAGHISVMHPLQS
jgi:hypothetical protein